MTDIEPTHKFKVFRLTKPRDQARIISILMLWFERYISRKHNLAYTRAKVDFRYDAAEQIWLAYLYWAESPDLRQYGLEGLFRVHDEHWSLP